MNEQERQRRYCLEVDHHELVLINNALNEVCNGIRIADGEFHARLGGSREETRAVLRRVNDLFNNCRA